MRFLFVDRIVQSVPGELVRGIKHINPAEPYLCQGKQGQYCFAPSLIGESLGQLAAWNVMVCNDFKFRPVAGVVASARLHRPVLPGETLLLESFIDRLDAGAVQYHSIARVGADTVFTVDGALGPLLPMSRFIAEDEVRRQFAVIDRPGDWPSLVSSLSAQRASLAIPDFSPVGKIPLRNLASVCVPMQFDSILHSEPGVSITAEKRISQSAPWFPDHFPFQPVLPLTVLLECKFNLARLFLEQAGFPGSWKISELRKIKMNEFVFPGDILQCHVKLTERDNNTLILRYRSEVNGSRVCVVDVIMKAEDD